VKKQRLSVSFTVHFHMAVFDQIHYVSMSVMRDSPKFDPRPFCVEFVVNKVALGQVSLKVFWLSIVIIILLIFLLNY